MRLVSGTLPDFLDVPEAIRLVPLVLLEVMLPVGDVLVLPTVHQLLPAHERLAHLRWNKLKRRNLAA